MHTGGQEDHAGVQGACHVLRKAIGQGFKGVSKKIGRNPCIKKDNTLKRIKMKTPLKELLEFLEQGETSNEDLHLKIDELLEKEKQVIIDSWNAGNENFDYRTEAEDYYDQTFEQ